MNDWAQQATLVWWQWVAMIAVQVTFVALVILVVDRLLPRRTWPQLRYALWSLVFVKLVLPPQLTLPVSVSRIAPVWAGYGRMEPAALSESSDGWIFALPVIWISVAGLMALAAIVRQRRFMKRWMADSQPATCRRIASLSARAAQLLSMRRAPAIRTIRRHGSPYVAGLLRPVVFVPETVATKTSDEALFHVLLHEFSHVKRRDAWVGLVLTSLTIAYWFHPVVWLAKWRMAALTEQTCDRSVARVLGDDVDAYRRTLLDFARRILDEPLYGRLSFVRPESLILARLRLLEGVAGESSWKRRAAVSLALVLGSSILLPLAQPAEETVDAVTEWIERPEGCLPLRYQVLGRLAEERAKQQPVPTESGDSNR